MKLFLILLILGCSATSQAQSFERFFESQTLRINYLHSGDVNDDEYEISSLALHGNWGKSQTNLIDTLEYGSQKVEVFDKCTKKLIYRYTYNTLFEEYRTTEEGNHQRKTFEECVLIPLPKRDAKIVFSTRKRGKNYEQKRVFAFRTKQKLTTTQPQCEVMDLHIGNSCQKAYDLLIIPEGYARQDSAKLVTDVNRCAAAILGCKPFKTNAYRLNIRALLCFSEESGISRETDSTTIRNTALGASFYTLNVERYLMLENVWKMHDLCSNVPYENILILCNTTKYGGGGIYNWYATVSDNETFDYVCVHELGHSIAGLADEYYTSEVSVQDFYPIGTEPVEPNITSLVDFAKKWQSLLGKNTPIPTQPDENDTEKLGVYEGAGYCEKGLYRPWLNCTMKEKIYDHFCPVCQRAIVQMLDFCTDK